jgi:hypothetical protein
MRHFLLVLLLLSCENKPINGVENPPPPGMDPIKTTTIVPSWTSTLPPGGKVYRLIKGKHQDPWDINAGIEMLSKNFAWMASFNDNTAYTTVNPENQKDINKLVGFSDCWSQHHTNSARFGWYWDLETKKHKIFAYAYADGQRMYSYITSVDLREIVTLSLEVKGREYVFFAKGVEVRLPRGCGNEWVFGYRLYPYFGGDEVAPQDMDLWLKVI